MNQEKGEVEIYVYIFGSIFKVKNISEKQALCY